MANWFLVVGTDPATDELNRRLQDLGYVTEVEPDAVQALRRIETNPPSGVLVVGELFPDEYGDAFMRDLRREARQLPVVHFGTKPWRKLPVFDRMGTAEVAELAHMGYLPDIALPVNEVDAAVHAALRRFVTAK